MEGRGRPEVRRSMPIGAEGLEQQERQRGLSGQGSLDQATEIGGLRPHEVHLTVVIPRAPLV